MGNIDFKVDKEAFVVGCTVADTSVEQSVERDFLLPDYCPDIFRILKCMVKPQITSQSINQGKLSFELSADIRVLYQSEGGGQISCIDQKLTYSKSVDIDGECKNPLVSLVPRTDYVNCRVVNQRRLDIRGAVTVKVKVTAEKSQELIVGAYGGNIQLRKQPVAYPSSRLTASKRITVLEELELSAQKPQVESIIRTDCTITPQEHDINNDRMLIKGEAEISMLYIGKTENDESKPECMRFSIPFSQITDCPGIDKSYKAYIDITPVECEITQKGDDASSLECELGIAVNCTALKFETCEVVCDAYSTCYECELEASTCKPEGVWEEISESHTLNTTVNSNDENIAAVYDVWCSLDNVSARYDADSGKYTVFGNASISVLGKSEGGSYMCFETETPFEHEIDGEYTDLSSIDARADVKSCSYTLTDGRSIDVRCEIRIFGYVCEQSAENMLCSLRVLTDRPKEKKQDYALKLCFCSEDENIWEIAKKYSTSVSAIREENELDGERTENSGILLIPLMN